ncbi:hypothetical protein EIP91_003641 [Steccherinum ochraceum]|uniref:F-BAR domain-containing protein n=1 Tax=Steccherinum ochraceum TaxID=92696 RepID=A0A4R0RA67_9APHY|nr:hypothetical protein EIP91_003641 [Steccherinum ochraceum]
MSARRQPSTTSLSRYARAHSTEFANKSHDFCNAFWGLGDGGVDVLFARMRGATRTMEELRNFWKERAMIEEQYAKRLASLAKFTLGRDEIGELRLCLDTIRLETDKQATFHMQVAQQIKNDLEGQTNQFLNRQLAHKRGPQAAIEKEFKTKQTHEGFVQKAREKYEGDCMRINSLTAQSTLQQGKELEKIHLKLERLQQTVQGNERDFANFTRVLSDTVARWEVDWKAYCDVCQDLEEDRHEFMKDNMWAYANAVSTVCVADDESCERLRLSLEQLEPERDMENFVRDYGTGNAIPDPPPFINFANPNAVPPSSQQNTSHTANFERVTQRPRPDGMLPPPQPEEDPSTLVNTAGVGAGGGRYVDEQQVQHAQNVQNVNGRSRSHSRASVRQPLPAGYQNGHNGANSSSQDLSRSSMGMRPADLNAEPIAPTEETMLKVGDRAYKVDLSRDPQARPSVMQNGAHGSSSVGQEDDPLARQMEQLRSGAGSNASNRRPQPAAQQPNGRNSMDNSSNLSLPPGARGGGPPNRNPDYRTSAEIVVGTLPSSVTASRPSSPNPPTAAFVQPPAGVTQAQQEAQEIQRGYQQSLPGEHRSRPGSRQSNNVAQPAPSQSHNRTFSSDGGRAGIGAQGRSPSPQPFRPPSRAVSPALQQPPQQPSAPANRRNSYRTPGPGGQDRGASPNSMSVPPAPAHQQRPTSPNSVGIALGSDGRVAVDSMADMYNAQSHQQQGSISSQGFRGMQQPAVPPPQMHQQYQQQQQQPLPPQRQPSYPPVNQQSYGAPPAAYPPSYPQQAPPAQPPAPQPPYQQQPQYGQPPQPQGYGQPPIGYQQQQPPPQGNGRDMQGALVPKNPVPNAGGYYGNQPPQMMNQSPMGYSQPQVGRSPSPQPPPPQPPMQSQQQAPPPTGQYTEDGRGVLFYVKAMYDYQAVIDEEFDFQQGDIIAVTDTPEDGWWSATSSASSDQSVDFTSLLGMTLLQEAIFPGLLSFYDDDDAYT